MAKSNENSKKIVNAKEKLPEISGKEIRLQGPSINPAALKSINDSVENAARIYKGILDTESMRNFMKQAAEMQRIAQNYFNSPGYVYFKKFLEEQQKERERLSRAIDAISPTLYNKPEDWIYAAPQRRTPIAILQEDKSQIRQEISEIIRESVGDAIRKIETDKIMKNKKPWQDEIILTMDGNLCYGKAVYELKSSISLPNSSM